MSSDYNVMLAVPRPSSGQSPHRPILAHSTIPKSLPAHHILIRVDRFGFSSNNITYQVLGEDPYFRYFDFHQASDAPDVHGMIPVWGFGTVVASNVSKIPVDERVFGYLAMARYLLLPVDVSNINQFNFYVPRSHLPPDRRPYNQITRCSHDRLYHPAEEDLCMLYRPLFWTSFWAEDWLFTTAKKPYNGASTILISSASAKTAFCLAYVVQRRCYHGVKVVGLTSKGNLAFTKGLGLYHAIFTYDEVEACAAAFHGTWIYIDIAGNETLNLQVWNKLGSRVVRNVSLGFTTLSPSAQIHVSGVPNSSTPNPGTASSPIEIFFMPEWLTERRRSLTASDISEIQYTAWTALMRDCKVWVALERTWGSEEVRRGYLNMVKGRVGPDKGLIWSLWDEPDGQRWELQLLRPESASAKL